MRTVTLEGESYETIDDFYKEISETLRFPDYFMRNLDSFEECLNEAVVKEPVTIIWKGHGRGRLTFGVSVKGVNYYPEILRILEGTKGVTLELK